ncbi:MAG: HAD family hydrolase [Candidatus Zixiibacteriota bacterium]|nr:MAG: HAD family hydrolase [candidate division Zixibacteria bacterium]
MAIRNIIFDFDGTLIDSSDGVVEAVNYSLRQVDEPEQPPEVIKRFIGYPLSQMYPTFSSHPVSELYRLFQQKAAQTVVASAEALPGVENVLNRLHDEGYRLGIASTKIRVHIDGIVEKLGWTGLIAAYTGGDEVERVKPDPEILKLTLSRLDGVAGETLVVGDTINDVLAARAMSMRVAAVESPYGGRQKLLEANPDFFVESISELSALLKEINRRAS